MSDDDKPDDEHRHEFILGPFASEDGELPEAVKKVIGEINRLKEKAAEENRERATMHAEMHQMQLRTFLESLDDEQLSTFTGLLGMIGNSIQEGDGNLVSIFYGMALATVWTRDPLSTGDLPS